MLAEAATPTGPEARSSTRTGGGREGTCTGPWRALSSGTCRVSRQPPLKSSQFVSGYKVICLSLAHGAKRWGCFAELISAATTSPWWPPASETSFSPSLRPSKKITSWWSGVFYKKIFKKMLPQKKWLGRGRPTCFFFFVFICKPRHGLLMTNRLQCCLRSLILCMCVWSFVIKLTFNTKTTILKAALAFLRYGGHYKGVHCLVWVYTDKLPRPNLMVIVSAIYLKMASWEKRPDVNNSIIRC